MMFLWFPLLFLVPLVIWWAVRPGEAGAGMGCCGMTHAAQTHAPGTPPAGTADPVDIVRHRLARGDITPEEYATIRRTLG